MASSTRTEGIRAFTIWVCVRRRKIWDAAGCPSAPCDSSGPGHFPNSVSGATKDRGAFKTAALRDVKLTAPYFHNGGKASLEQVVAFYNQGGDFANPEKAKRIKPLSLSASDQTALVDFLRNGLTDCRVENQLAPFDHPALSLPNGDALPALGADGRAPACEGLKTAINRSARS